MKKLLTLIVACLMISALALTASAASNGYNYNAPAGTPTVDGIAESLWDAAEWAKVESRDIGPSDGGHGQFKVMHDDTYVYFLMQYTDENVVQGNENFHIHLHEDNCASGKDCQDYTWHIISGGGAWAKVDRVNLDGEGEPVMVEAFAAAEDGMTRTFEIAMKLHGEIPTEAIGMEVTFEDYNPDWCGPHSWCSTSGNANTVADWGTITFVGETVAVDTQAPAGDTTEAPTDDTTEAPAGDTTEAPAADTTEAPAADTTEAPAKDTEPTVTDGAEPFPTVAIIGIAAAVVALIAVVVVLAKKKR